MRSWLSKIWILAFLPPLAILFLIVKFGVNIPFWDQWDLIPVLEKVAQHTLTFNDLFKQHNEHRLFFPRLIMVGMAKITAWNIRWEMILIWLLALGLLISLIALAHQTFSGRKDLLLKLAVVFSFIVFSMTQWENWLWGWQIQILLNVLMVVLALYFLTKEKQSAVEITVAVTAAVVATFSFANGLLLWPIGALVLLVYPARWKKIKIFSWLFVMLVVYGLYFWGYHQPVNHQDWQSILLHDPLVYLSYFFVYLGAPLGYFNKYLAGICGLSSVIFFFWLIVRFFRKRADWSPMLPWFGLCLYAVFSALMTGLGRAGYGIGQAMHPRYVTISNFWWLGLIILVLLAWPKICWKFQRMTRVAVIVAIIVWLAGSFVACRQATGLSHGLQELKAGLLNDSLNQENLMRLYPDARVVMERMAILKKYHWSLFAE